MKKGLIVLAAAFALAGCNKGGTGDDATIDTGSGSSSSSVSVSTNDGADVSIRGSANGGSISGSGSLSVTNEIVVTNKTEAPNPPQ
jgi:hypothetical protein